MSTNKGDDKVNQVKVKRTNTGHYIASVDNLKFKVYASYCERKPQWIVENMFDDEVYCFEFKNYAIEALQHWTLEDLKEKALQGYISTY